MSRSSSILRLEVVGAHSSSWGSKAADQFRGSLEIVLKGVEESLRTDYPSIQLRLRCLTGEEACALQSGDVTWAVVILDVTECDERIALFAGRVQGFRIPCVVACRTDSEDRARGLGLSTPDLVRYASMDEFIVGNSVLRQQIQRAISHERIHNELVYQFWFPRETSTVWVVCPQITEPSEFASRSSPDYTYLDNLGDTDALLEVLVFLSQYYPCATIERFSARDLPDGHTSGNLVVIGGPGCGEISNEICRDMMIEVGSRVSYSADCERMTVVRGEGDAVELRAEYRTTGRNRQAQERPGLWRDQGYFARSKNPLNENATVVLINGLHTAGVLAAARAFGERREALRNFLAVLASSADPRTFECHFVVQLLNGQVKVPTVDVQNILSLDRADDAPVGTQACPGRRMVAASTRDSVRVLFIAGDRGGPQVSQLQIPKEYHAIQAVLRGCEHRDLIWLANPILGATRDRLAEAYRERPAIVHFAGHGNDRSLSIIEDHGLLANETALSADQLCDVLKTMEQRVRLCVLNACGSAEVARRIVEACAADHAIGWPAKVSDSAAIAFSRALYAALGDGRSVIDAVNVATVACGAECRPVFVAGEGANAPILVIGERRQE